MEYLEIFQVSCSAPENWILDILVHNPIPTPQPNKRMSCARKAKVEMSRMGIGYDMSVEGGYIKHCERAILANSVSYI